MKTKKVAWIEIWNYKTELCIQTVKEECENEDQGFHELQLLHEKIKSLSSLNDGIILETQNLGVVRIPIQFIQESMITIVFGNIEDFDDLIEENPDD